MMWYWMGQAPGDQVAYRTEWSIIGGLTRLNGPAARARGPCETRRIGSGGHGGPTVSGWVGGQRGDIRGSA